jgi:hypothetical protein
MNVMKGAGGYKSPGLVQLRLGLKDQDGTKRVEKKEMDRGGNARKQYELVPSAPMVSGPPGMGYHAKSSLYEVALDRFTKKPPPDFSAILADDYEEDEDEDQIEEQAHDLEVQR